MSRLLAWFGDNYHPPPPPILPAGAPVETSPGVVDATSWAQQVATRVVTPPQKRPGKALVLGRFYPLHVGHAFLLRTAAATMEGGVVVVVMTRRTERITGVQRARAVRAVLPNARVEVATFTPEGSSAEPRFWDSYARWFQEHRPWFEGCTALFSSEPPAEQLTRRVGLELVLVDPRRETFPVQGRDLRRRPWAHWASISPTLHSSFRRTVALVGPPGAGKTTLGRELAARSGTSFAPEVLEAYQPEAPPSRDHWVHLWLRHEAAVSEALRRCRCFAVLDGDHLSLTDWELQLTGYHSRDPQPSSFTLLLDEAGWRGRPERDFPAQRHAQVQRLRARLTELKARWSFVTGPLEERAEQVQAAVLGWASREPARFEE